MKKKGGGLNTVCRLNIGWAVETVDIYTDIKKRCIFNKMVDIREFQNI